MMLKIQRICRIDFNLISYTIICMFVDLLEIQKEEQRVSKVLECSVWYRENFTAKRKVLQHADGRISNSD